MSQDSESTTIPDWRQRRRRAPPTRLSWPPSKSSQSSRSDIDVNHPARKRQRRKAETYRSGVSKNSSAPDASSIWVEKHAPMTIAELCVAPKKVKEVHSWLEEAMTTAGESKKLLVLVGNPGVGKSTMVRVLASHIGLHVCDWSESAGTPSNGYRDHDSEVFWIDNSSPLNAFEEFLQQAGAGLRSLDIQSTSSEMIRDRSKPTSYQQSLVLLDDLPHLFNASAEQRFREILGHHLRHSLVPTVLIFSDVSEGKHKPSDLERMIDPQQLYSQDMVRILQIQNVTKPKMKKILSGIAEKEKFRVPNSSLFEQLHDQCRGDLRHAIWMLQLEATGKKHMVTSSTLLSGGQNNTRDYKLSSFHALGKLLYAKRIVDPTSGRTMLNFNPEETMERSDMGLGGSLVFLEHHSVDFYTEIEELSDAMQFFSDAAMLLDYPMDVSRPVSAARLNHSHLTVSIHFSHPLQPNRRDSFFPDGYVASLAGRAVARTNIHPTANKFRQFSTPKSFEVARKRNQNEVCIQQLFKRLWSSSGSTSGSQFVSLSSAFSSMDTLVADFLPCLRLIAPDRKFSRVFMSVMIIPCTYSQELH